MGKQLRRNDSDIGMKVNRPGCISGIFQILDYHHWHILKKILPHKWHGEGRHARCGKNLREHFVESGIGKAQYCRDDEANQFVVQQSSTETNHANKRSMKKEGPIRRVLGLTGRSRLWRTVSIHHLEQPSDPRHGGRGTTSATDLLDPPILKDSEELAAGDIADYLGQTWDAKKHGIFYKKCEKARKASMDQNIVDLDSDLLDEDVSGNKLKECADVLELLSINKDLFVKIANQFNSLQASDSCIKLKKSGSFPTADLARLRNFRPSKLEHKQNESWSLPKREKLLISAQEPKLGASKSLKDIYVADSFIGSAIEQEKRLVKNQEDVNHLEDAKQKAEHATEESRRTSFRNNSLDRYAQLFEHGFRRVGRWHHSKSLKATNENDFLPGRHGRRTFRRNLSLPEFEFYSAQPPNESSSGAFSSELPSGSSLDSTADITRGSHNEPKSECLPSSTEEYAALEAVVGTEFRNDLVYVESDYQNGPSENADELNMGKSYELENILLTDAVAGETEDSEKIVQGSDRGPNVECPAGLPVGIDDGDMDEPIKAEISLSQEQEMDFEKNSHTKLAQPSPDSVLENNFQDLTPASAEPPFSEGSGLKPRSIDFEEWDTLINSESRSNTDGLSDICVKINHEKIKNVNKGAYNRFLDDEQIQKDEAEFNYVRDVLELSGFTGKEYLEEWHLLDQPMSPSVFEEMEACLPDETRPSSEEVGLSCDHQLLFDLVNQALLEMYQRSFTYCPRALSYSCRVPPMPVGHHVVEAVWASIRGRLSSGQEEKEQTLNDVVAGDLAKDDGWMNLQLQTECLALDVEDMIFHELLDEILCC